MYIWYHVVMTIFLGADHAGYQLKESLKKFLSEQGHTVTDCGAFRYDENDDYPDFIKPLAKKVTRSRGKAVGIILGGSGEGEAMVANRKKGIRAAVYYGGAEKIIKLSREHNDANVLSLGARFLTETEAKRAVALWLKTPFSRKERHLRRIRKVDIR